MNRLTAPLLGIVGLAVLGWQGCGPVIEETQVYTVESRPFHHQVTAEGRLRATESTKLQVPSEARRSVRLAWLAPEGSRLEQGDVVARFDGKAMQEQLEDSRTDYESNRLELERSEISSDVELRGLEKDLSIAEIELEHAKEFQKTDDEVFSRRSIQEDAIDGELAEDRKHHAQSSAGTRKSLAKTEQELLTIKRRQVEMEIDRSEKGLQALELVAPHDGVLALATDWRGEKPSIGSEMWSGQDIGEIPDMSRMEAQVFVLEADAGGLAEGKRAEVIVEAHPGKVYPAVIQSVEAVAQPRFKGSPVQYFGVVLTFEATDREIMKPGGRVVATLYLEERDDALVIPRQALFRGLQESGTATPPDRAAEVAGAAELAGAAEVAGAAELAAPSGEQENRAQVYVRRASGSFEVKNVSVGATSLSEVVIEDGLEAGDVIALAEPGRLMDGPQGAGGGGSAMALGGS